MKPKLKLTKADVKQIITWLGWDLYHKEKGCPFYSYRNHDGIGECGWCNRTFKISQTGSCPCVELGVERVERKAKRIVNEYENAHKSNK